VGSRKNLWQMLGSGPLKVKMESRHYLDTNILDSGCASEPEHVGLGHENLSPQGVGVHAQPTRHAMPTLGVRLACLTLNMGSRGLGSSYHTRAYFS